MKTLKKILSFILITLVIMVSLNSFTNITVKASDLYQGDVLDVKIKDTREFRGVWVSALVSDISRFSSVSQYQTQITNVLEKMEKYNFNTLVFHIRIYNDAFYDSKYCKYSSLYRTNATWDPLPWIIDECHKRGIEFHAWMNPYRVSTSVSSSLDSIASKFDGNNAASNPSNLLKGNTYIILNPGIPTVQTFLADVVMEVVEKYDVDAIHFDDYFYAAGIDDSLTYKMYGKEYSKITDFRRASVSKLIESLHNSIKEHNIKNNKAVKLGISPTAIYRCGDGIVTYDKDGHAITNGAAMSSYFDQHYESACADTLLWIQKGWIDYIVPQLYVDGTQFTTMSTWWDKVVKNEKCIFVAGITEASCDWEHFEALQNPGGICLFSYKAMDKLMSNKKASEHMKEEVLPKVNYTNENFENDTLDLSFNATLVKLENGYKIAINQPNELINWYQITNNLNESYDKLTNITKTYVDEREFNNDLIYTITPIYKNGEIGKSITLSPNNTMYEINFYDESNELITSLYLNQGDKITYPELKQSDTLTYSWDKEIDIVTENIDIHMITTEKKYVITYVDPDGIVITTQEYKFGESLTLPEIPESKKYTYTKWKVASRYTVEGDDTITLNYKLINYTLKVYGNDILLLTKTVNYGDDLLEILNSITELKIRDHQIFVGFDNQSDTVTGDMIVNVVYETKKYTVTYKDNDQVIKVETYNHGDNVTLDNTFSKEGFTLNGFILNGKIVNSIENIQEDIVLNYNFIENSGCNKETIFYQITGLFIILFLLKKRKY